MQLTLKGSHREKANFEFEYRGRIFI